MKLNYSEIFKKQANKYKNDFNDFKIIEILYFRHWNLFREFKKLSYYNWPFDENVDSKLQDIVSNFKEINLSEIAINGFSTEKIYKYNENRIIFINNQIIYYFGEPGTGKSYFAASTISHIDKSVTIFCEQRFINVWKNDNIKAIFDFFEKYDYLIIDGINELDNSGANICLSIINNFLINKNKRVIILGRKEDEQFLNLLENYNIYKIPFSNDLDFDKVVKKISLTTNNPIFVNKILEFYFYYFNIRGFFNIIETIKGLSDNDWKKIKKDSNFFSIHRHLLEHFVVKSFSKKDKINGKKTWDYLKNNDDIFFSGIDLNNNILLNNFKEQLYHIGILAIDNGKLEFRDKNFFLILVVYKIFKLKINIFQYIKNSDMTIDNQFDLSAMHIFENWRRENARFLKKQQEINFEITENEILEIKKLNWTLNIVYKKIINLLCIDSFISFDNKKQLKIKKKYQNYHFNKFVSLESILISKYDFHISLIKQSIQEVRTIKEVRNIAQIIMDFIDFDWKEKWNILLWMTLSFDKNIQYIALCKILTVLLEENNDNLYNEVWFFYKSKFNFQNSQITKKIIFNYLIYTAIINLYYYFQILNIKKGLEIFKLNLNDILNNYKNYYSYQYSINEKQWEVNFKVSICKKHSHFDPSKGLGLCPSEVNVGENFYYNNYDFIAQLWGNSEYHSDCNMVYIIKQIQNEYDSFSFKKNYKYELYTYEKSHRLFYNTKSNLKTWLTTYIIDKNIVKHLTFNKDNKSSNYGNWPTPINLFDNYVNLVIKQKTISQNVDLDYSILQNLKVGNYNDFKKKVFTFLIEAIKKNYIFIKHEADRYSHKEGFIDLSFCEQFSNNLTGIG